MFLTPVRSLLQAPARWYTTLVGKLRQAQVTERIRRMWWPPRQGKGRRTVHPSWRVWCHYCAAHTFENEVGACIICSDWEN